MIAPNASLAKLNIGWQDGSADDVCHIGAIADYFADKHSNLHEAYLTTENYEERQRIGKQIEMLEKQYNEAMSCFDDNGDLK